MLLSLVRGINAMNDWLGRVVMWFALVVVGLIAVEVLLRDIFGTTTIFTHEVSIFIFAAYIMLAGGYNLLHRRHVTMDLIYSRWSPRVRMAADMVGYVVLFIFASLMLWKTIEAAIFSIQIRETSLSIWAPPIYPVRVLLPVGFTLLLLQGLAELLDTANVFFRGGTKRVVYEERIHMKEGAPTLEE